VLTSSSARAPSAPNSEPDGSRDRVAQALTRGAAGSMIVKVCGAAAALLCQIALARLMTPAEYGTYSWAVSWLTTLAMFTRVGADMAFLRYIPGFIVASDWPRLSGLLRWGTRVSLFASCGVAIPGVVILWTTSERPASESWTLSIALSAIPLFSLSFLRQGALRALRKVVLAELPESVIRFVLVAVGVGAVFVVSGRPVSAVEAMVGTFAAFTVSFVIGHVWLKRALPPQLGGARPLVCREEWLRTSVPLLVATSMAMLINQAGIIALGEFGDVEGAGVFAIVVRIAMLLGFGLMAINSIAAPLIAELHGAGRLVELQGLLTKSARMVTAYTFVAGAGIVITGDWLLSWFGELPRSGHRALVIMVAGQMVTSCMGSVSYLVGMTGHHRPGAIIAMISAAACLALNVVLVPRFGIEGAAVATSLSLVTSSVAAALYVKRRLGLTSTPV
jgi:O-antigen/teichoic acid export membrane protein